MARNARSEEGPVWAGWAAALIAVLLPQIPAQLGAPSGITLTVLVLTTVAMAPIGLAASSRLWAAIVGLAVMAMVPFAGSALADTPLAGPVITGDVVTAANHRWASAYHVTGAVERTDLTGLAAPGPADIRHPPTTYQITPVVAPGGGPVRIWIVDDNARPARLPPTGTVLTFARLLGWTTGERAAAVREVARREGLAVPAHLLLVRPVRHPAAVWWSGWLKLIGIALVAGALWALLRQIRSPQRSR